MGTDRITVEADSRETRRERIIGYNFHYQIPYYLVDVTVVCHVILISFIDLSRALKSRAYAMNTKRVGNVVALTSSACMLKGLLLHSRLLPLCLWRTYLPVWNWNLLSI